MRWIFMAEGGTVFHRESDHHIGFLDFHAVLRKKAIRRVWVSLLVRCSSM